MLRNTHYIPGQQCFSKHPLLLPNSCWRPDSHLYNFQTHKVLSPLLIAGVRAHQKLFQTSIQNEHKLWNPLFNYLDLSSSLLLCFMNFFSLSSQLQPLGERFKLLADAEIRFSGGIDTFALLGRFSELVLPLGYILEGIRSGTEWCFGNGASSFGEVDKLPWPSDLHSEIFLVLGVLDVLHSEVFRDLFDL